MDEYVDVFVDKIPGATADEKKVWFYFLLLFVLVREIFPKNRWDHFVQEKFDNFIERQLVSPSLGTVNIKQSKFCLLLPDCF